MKKKGTIRKDFEEIFVFVVGNSRSGTSMMGNILARNNFICYFPELHFFEQLWSPGDDKKFLSEKRALHLATRLLSIEQDGYLTQKNHDRYIDEARTLIKDLKQRKNKIITKDVYRDFLIFFTKKSKKIIPCEKTPKNVFYINEIIEFYPKAKIINMIRDPRDVLQSQKRRWKRRYLGAKETPLRETIRAWLNYHPITQSKLWNASINAAEKFKENPKVIFVMFEKLLEKPEKKIEEICEFIGIQFDKDMLNIPQKDSSLEPDNLEKKGIKKERTGQWQKGGLNSTEIYFVQKITRKYMDKYGYKTVQVSPGIVFLAYYSLSFIVKFILAFIFNFKRMKSIKDVIKRRLH
jgi:hypothetical protein